jgi:hypothetical protein
MIYELIWIGTGIIAAVATFWLHTRFAISPVMASALVTLIIALSVLPFGDSTPWITAIPYVAIGGSFIGMSLKKYIKGFDSLILAAVIFGVIFSRSSQFFEGFGGALGTSACISVLTAISWRKLIKRTRRTAKHRLNRANR